MTRTLLPLPLTLVLFAGCSDDSIGSSQFVVDYPDVYCSYLMRCCDAVERSYTTKDACVGAVTTRVKEMVASDAADPAVDLVTDKARSCLDALRGDCTKATAARDCLLEVTLGRQKAGDDCVYSPECESFYCIQPQKGIKGYCASSSGGSCSGDDRACSQDAYCDDATLQCLARHAAGDNCHRPEECQSGICAPQKICVTAPTALCDGE